MGVFGVPSVRLGRRPGVRAGGVVVTVVALLAGTAVAVSAPAGASAGRHSSGSGLPAQASTRKPLPVSAPLAGDRAAGGRTDGTTGPAGEHLGTRVLPATVTHPQGPRRGAALDQPLTPRRSATSAAPASVRPLAVTTGATQYQAPGLVPVPSTTSRPGARLYAAGAYDATHNLDILFGGHTSAGATAGDTWTWDGTTWTLKAPATSPPARDGATMAYDTATGTTILFGGFGTGYLNDTWSWNGTTWTHLTPATSPPARRWASMAYDPALGKIVLFGGCSAGGYLNDTWLWNGTTWASVTTPPALTARDDVGLSYDQTAGNMVLYGGLTGTSTYLGDTWLYGSTGWTQAAPVHYPGARGGMGFAYDPTLGRNVLFGGVDATSTYNDQWMWDGSDWRQGIVPTAWGQDANEVFLTGAGNGQLMIQGGYDWAAAGYYDGTGLYDWASGGAPKSNTLTTHPVDDRSTVSMNPFASTARVSATDYSESTVGQALNVSRDYNFNYGGYYGSVGWGWTLTSGIDTYVLGGYPDSSLMVVGLRGAAYANYFHYNGSAYVSPVGLNADLAAISGGWTLTYHATSEKLTFNSSGLMIKDVDRNGNGITVAYDVNNFALSITDGNGRVYTVAYSANGFIHTITAPDGRVVTYTQDAYGYLTGVTDAANDTTTYSNPASELDIQDPKFNITKLTYVIYGFTVTYPEATPNTVTYANTPPDLSVSKAWETTTVTDQNSHATAYQVAFNGDVVKTTDPLGHSRKASYYPSNEIQTATDATTGVGNTVSFNYDASNNPTAITLPSGATTTAQYSNGGGCSSTDSIHPYLAKCVSDPQGNQGTFTYDGPGNITSNKVPTAGEALTFTYNPSTPTCGGKVGQRCTAVDGNSHATNYHYNANGDQTTITPPSPQGATTQTFDAAGRLLTSTDGRGQKTTYTLDGDDRVTQVLTGGATTCTYSLGTCVTYIYDNNGNRTSQQDKTGLTSFGYDVMNRETSKTAPAASPLSVTYDSVGNELTYQDAGGTVTYGFNAANQLTSLAEPGGSCTGTISLCTTFTPDNNGKRTGTAYPGGTTMTTTLDKSGRPTEVKSSNGATVYADLKYTYLKGTTDTTLVQTRTDVKTGLVTTYSYDFLNELTNAVEKNGGTTTASWLYCYDLAGNRTGSSTTAGATCGAPSTTYTYNADNELTALNGSSTGWSYDTAGNETAGNSSTPRLSESYTPSNQLSSLTTSGGTAAATYAGLTNDERVTAGTITYQTGEQGLATQTNSGLTLNWTRDPSGTLISERGLGASYYYLFDGQGSVIASVNSTGTLVATYSYDPYGNTRATTGSLVNPMRYTGGYSDGSGLYHLGARYYDPNLGRFTQPDPAAQGPNLYAYAGNNPVSKSDPTGRDTIEDWGIGLGIFGSADLAGTLAFGAGATTGAVSVLLGVGSIFSVGIGLGIIACAIFC